MDVIEREDGELLKEFQDVESGKSRTRPGLMAALDFCAAQSTPAEPCTLVIAKLDRLARDVEFTFSVLNRGVQIRFSDMPQVNTMILGVFASVAQYERELIAGRTKGALGAIKDDIKKNGGHVSKTGRYIKHLGNEKGYDMYEARNVAYQNRSQRANDWRESSALYLWVTNQILKGRTQKDILADAEERYKKNPSLYGTRRGLALNKGTLSKWAKEIRAD
jgi:DNA invertase Pin-like site-specific DNA recombinase